MTNWAVSNGISIRGHTVFWESPQAQQPWVKSLNPSQLRTAMDTRINQVVPRYKGKFKHWDVDNEALHPDYYPPILGSSIQTWMYQTTQQLDPNVQMFINDFNVLEECDSAANPDTFIAQAQGIEAQGFQVSHQQSLAAKRA